jgi:glycosyltransferase involved in cell wall biosynthesis
MSEKPRASIIVPSRGMDDNLKKLFDSLANELAGKNVEVILADDGSPKPLDFLSVDYKGKIDLKVVRQQPLGPAAARNSGIRQAASDIFIFVDSDVVPQPGWFEAIIAPLEQDPGIAGVEGKTIASNIAELTPFSHFLYNFDGGAYLTCNIAYRRSWVERAGLFDERFKHPWREDSDLAFSILEMGGKIIFEPKAMVDHLARPVRLWRMFWFYPVRRGYDWILFRKHPALYNEKVHGTTDLSEISFILTFLIAVASFLAGWTWAGFVFLLIHQAVYNHILLRHIHIGTREAYNLAVDWKTFIKAYPFYYPATFLGLASVLWGWIKFSSVKPFQAKTGG